MTENAYDVETVRKKFEDLDNEISTFLQAIKEVKEMRDTFREIPEQLEHNEIEIEQQKKELDSLMSTTNNLLITFEEQSKGAIFDLEKKTDILTKEVKTGISQINNIFQQNSNQLRHEQIERFEDITKMYTELNSSHETLKNMVRSIEGSFNILKNNYFMVSKIFDKFEISLIEIKKNLAELQKKPNEYKYKIKELEEYFKNLINEKHSKQQKFTVVVLIILIAGILFSAISLNLL